MKRNWLTTVQVEEWSAGVISTGIAAWFAHGQIVSMAKATVVALTGWLL